MKLYLYIEANKEKYIYTYAYYKLDELSNFTIKESKNDDKEVNLIQAVIDLLKFFKNEKPIQIYTSSVFLENLIKDWIYKWRKDGFILEDGKRPNYHLLVDLYDIIKDMDVSCTSIDSVIIDELSNLLTK